MVSENLRQIQTSQFDRELHFIEAARVAWSAGARDVAVPSGTALH